MATQKETLGHTFKSVWTHMDAAQVDACMAYCEGYKTFLSASKTERESVREIKLRAEAAGYKPIERYCDGTYTLEAGSKIYALNRDKAIILFHMGHQPLNKGLRIIGAHIDSPRIDVKPYPLYEDSGLGFLKTHYYGGVKKYQWTAMPLALHGVVFNGRGERIEVVIGEGPDDPIFTITDLLPHLAKDQHDKKLGEGIEGETLNLLVGNQMAPSTGADGTDEQKQEGVKQHLLQLLKDTYGIEEVDFTTSELEIVPAGAARDTGLDRSMIAGYGQDDRVCAYTALTAILDLESVDTTACVLFMDKEEVGSQGNTGSQSAYFEHMLAELIALQSGRAVGLNVRRALSASEVLSADVGAAYDPNYASVYDKKNASVLGCGVQISKYTGARGKGGCNDANAEFLSKVRGIFEAEQVVWQIGELGKVDQGGGGTIAYILANANAEVVDCGVPVLSMHAPYEITSKADIYMTHRAYRAFLK